MLRYSINTTIDGCVDHTAIGGTEEIHAHATDSLSRADAMLMGRTTFSMMEQGWRPVAHGERPDWLEEWMVPFAETIDQIPKYVVSGTLESSDWNAQVVRPVDLEALARELHNDAREILLSGVTLPLAIANLGLIDRYELVVHPYLAGRGPTLFGGLAAIVKLDLMNASQLPSGAMVLDYVPAESPVRG